MRFLRYLVIVGVIFIVGCAQPGRKLQIQVSEQANPWTHLNLYNDPENFQFAIVSDRTGGHEPGVFAEAVEKLNLLKPELVICVGDLIEGYSEDEAELKQQWDEFEGIVDQLQMPFFYVPGNHDLSNKVMFETWHERFGRTYYHFIYHDVLFLVLDTQDTAATGFGNEQLEYFRKTLEENRDVRWTLLFMHQPIWRRKDIRNWPKLESALGERGHTVFAGHVHKYSKWNRAGKNYYTLSVTGGNRFEGAEPMDFDEGRFDHIVWATMTDDGPVLANFLLEGIFGDEHRPR